MLYIQILKIYKKAKLKQQFKLCWHNFERENIDFEVKVLPEENYADHLYDYISEIEADIVLFMTDNTKELLLMYNAQEI